MSKKRITFGQIFMVIVVLALSAGLVMNYLSLHEVSADLIKANETYEKMVNHGEALNRRIEEQVNFNNIDQLATERLGMVKLESYQIRYVDIVEADTMTAVQTEENQNGLMNNIVRSFSILVEYLK